MNDKQQSPDDAEVTVDVTEGNPLSETAETADDATDVSAVAADTEATESSDPIEVPPTVGQQLRAAREAAHLTLADVAQALKFSPRQIELLEADDYEALPGNTIVRGFIRSYARLLKLSPELLLTMLDERALSAPAEVRPPDNMGIAAQPGETRQFSLLASAAIVIGLAALLLGLWHFFGPSGPQPVATNDEPRPAEVEAQVIPQSHVATPPLSPADSATVVPPVDVASSTATPVPTSASPILLFVFEGKSWLEVTDGAKQKLHTGENLAGTQLTLSGKPPFDIVVGNAGKVKLSYGGHEIDLAPHTRAEVARLKVE